MESVYVIQKETNFPHMGYVQSDDMKVASSHDKAMEMFKEYMESHGATKWDSHTKHFDTEIFHFFSEENGDINRVVIMKVQVDK
jgi:hypothetical protein